MFRAGFKNNPPQNVQKPVDFYGEVKIKYFS
jgi:hypothetical protein